MSFLRDPAYDRHDLAASLVIDNTINGMAIAIWACGGLIFLAVFVLQGVWIRLLTLATVVAMLALCALLVLVQRRGLVSGFLNLLARWRPFAGIARRYHPHALRIDQHISGFYRRNRRGFLLSLWYHVLEKVHGAAEFWVIFRGLGLTVSWGKCFFIFAVVGTLDNLLFFVQLGGMEAWVSSLLALMALDRNKINITAALFRRLRMIFWAGVALVMAGSARLLARHDLAVKAERL
jgi:hypothetical protein